jgi:hypothetical protein
MLICFSGLIVPGGSIGTTWLLTVSKWFTSSQAQLLQKRALLECQAADQVFDLPKLNLMALHFLAIHFQ